MIDINELRRLTQAATPGPWIAAGPSFGESLPKHLNEVVVDREGDEDDGYSICITPIGLDQECSDDMAFIAAANPLAIEELLDRLEAAESEALEQARLNGMGAEREAALLAKLEAAEKSDAESLTMYRKARDERDALRAKVKQMEKQEPVAYLPLSSARILESGVIANAVVWNCRDKAASDMPLYALPGAKGEKDVCMAETNFRPERRPSA